MRYREMRWPCAYSVALHHGADRMQATIINVSSAGVRLRLDPVFASGEVLTLDLGKKRVAATVRWCRSGMCGLRLLTPLAKLEVATIRHGRVDANAVTSGRWNTHLHELR